MPNSKFGKDLALMMTASAQFPLRVATVLPTGVYDKPGSALDRDNYEFLPSVLGPERMVECGVDELARQGGYFIVPLIGGRNRLETLLPSLPEACLEPVRQGRCGLLFDHSGEGPTHTPKKSVAWHDRLRALDIPADSVIYLNQSHDYRSAYNAWCDEQHLRKRVKILRYDYHIKRFFTRSWPDPQRTFARRQEAFLSRDSLERDFVCLNFKPRLWRLALLTWLLRDDLWDRGYVSFGGFSKSDMPRTSKSSVWAKGGGPIEQFSKLPLSKGLDEQLAALQSKGRIYFGHEQNEDGLKKNGRVFDIESSIYDKSCFSLVTETEMTAYTKRITEKPFKPLAHGHPIIVFGGVGSLQLIRDLGFRTFGNWIDESYDGMSEPGRRFRAAYKAFKTFRLQAAKLVFQDEALRETLLYNMRHALLGVAERYATLLDPALCAEIEAAVPLPDKVPVRQHGKSRTTANRNDPASEFSAPSLIDGADSREAAVPPDRNLLAVRGQPQ